MLMQEGSVMSCDPSEALVDLTNLLVNLMDKGILKYTDIQEAVHSAYWMTDRKKKVRESRA